MKYINYKHKTINNLLHIKMNLKILGIPKLQQYIRSKAWQKIILISTFSLFFLSRSVGGQKYLWIFFHRNKYSNFEYFCQSMASWQTFLNVSIQVLKHLYEYKSAKLKIWLPTIEFLQLWCCANLISVTKLSKSETVLYFCYVSDIF